jgi:predicted nuclease of restriction endonuclease-like (RecB) superfamily
MASPRKLNKNYDGVLQGIVEILNAARSTAARAVNSVMTATYWEVGRRIVEFEQDGQERAEYGDEVILRLAKHLTERFGRGFSKRNLDYMRNFYLGWPTSRLDDVVAQGQKVQTPSALSKTEFPLPWSHYVQLMGVKEAAARAFYEREALAGGWTIRQLKRQVGSQFFERTVMSRNKKAMLLKGEKRSEGDEVSVAEQVKDPLVLEFLDLKDEYSESELEEALIRQLEDFLLELGGDFTFVGRQKRLRIDDVWFRVDLVLYHRRLRCLVLIDLKLDEFSHADVGQMNVYLNYARRHWTHDGENPPVGLILCAGKRKALAEYAMQGIENKMLAAEYRTTLPATKSLEREVAKQREAIEALRERSQPARLVRKRKS